MLYPDTQAHLQLIREQQAALRRQAELDGIEQPTVRESRSRRYRLRLVRVRQTLRPAAHPS